MGERIPEEIVIKHHLLLMGLPACCFSDEGGQRTIILAGEESGYTDLDELEKHGGMLVCVQPPSVFLEKIGASLDRVLPKGLIYQNSSGEGEQAVDLYSLHSAQSYTAKGARILVSGPEQSSVWFVVRKGRATILVVGTQLAADLVRFRQGDPKLAERGQQGSKWGFSEERPNYLFELQLLADPLARPVDHWSYKLAASIAKYCGVELLPILPDGAPGAVVVTGDDDQAELHKYTEQLEVLEPLPITYFLHPLTRHDAASISQLASRQEVELGLHPDALEAPQDYARLLITQVKWFEGLLGFAPKLLRNHGFLNDGYWGHLTPWMKNGIEASANLPGLDGTVLNGSLLPARVCYAGELTPHWSVLTPIGDGVRFALGMSPEESTDCIRRLAERITSSGIPGLIVLNLHPQNIAETRSMHEAVHELVGQGFVAMTFGQSIDWFKGRDSSSFEVPRGGRVKRFFCVLMTVARRLRIVVTR